MPDYEKHCLAEYVNHNAQELVIAKGDAKVVGLLLKIVKIIQFPIQFVRKIERIIKMHLMNCTALLKKKSQIFKHFVIA